MLVVNILIKVLALVEYILDYFVILGDPLYETGNAECGFVCNVYQPTMTACGSGLIDNLMGLTFGLVELAPKLLCALFAIE